MMLSLNRVERRCPAYNDRARTGKETSPALIALAATRCREKSRDGSRDPLWQVTWDTRASLPRCSGCTCRWSRCGGSRARTRRDTARLSSCRSTPPGRWAARRCSASRSAWSSAVPGRGYLTWRTTAKQGEILTMTGSRRIYLSY